MAKTETAWRCSQCGAINEPGSRACHNCGKWPSLFDLQAGVEDVPARSNQATFEPEIFETETYEAPPFETGMPVSEETYEPDVDTDEVDEPRSRFPRWIVSAIWIAGLVVWFIVNALADRG